MEENQLEEVIKTDRDLASMVCPECGCGLIREGYCKYCLNCGWSLCSI